MRLLTTPPLSHDVLGTSWGNLTLQRRRAVMKSSRGIPACLMMPRNVDDFSLR